MGDERNAFNAGWRADTSRGRGTTGRCGGAVAAGGSQIGAGLLLTAGAFTPLAALAAIGVMTIAITVKWGNGLWVQHDGFEYPLVLVIIAAVLALTGPGALSLDAAFNLAFPTWTASAAIAAGIGSGLLARIVLHR